MKYFLDDGKTTSHLKKICETELQPSKWINDTCYYFYNDGFYDFDEAQSICSEAFKYYGFENGRIYEPQNLDDFKKTFEMAEDFNRRCV